jgi:hypothetical protein
MSDRAFLRRLRTSGGPSHDLLVLLDRHRVMTTDQLARATATPKRTVRYRMERLHSVNLVDCVRPGRERGSAPRHWWLRPVGARLVAGTAAADGRPSGMFVAHAAAISEVWLVLVEHGPAHGLQVKEWLTDRAGWQEWQGAGRWSNRPQRLTPDAVVTLAADGSEAVVFVEVDLASMTQTVLKQKVGRYLAYADDLVWQDSYPYCPPMLLFTTTGTRAATFVRVAGQVLAKHQRRFEDTDPAAALVVAACGYVRDPAVAATDILGRLVTARDLWPGQADAGDATLVLPATAGMDGPWTRASMTRIAEDWLMGGLVDRRLFLSASGAVLAQALTAFLGTSPPAATVGAPTPEDPLVDQIAASIPQLQMLDDERGGAAGLNYVGAQVRAVLLVLRDGGHSEATTRRLLVALADLTQLAGWKAFDAGQKAWRSGTTSPVCAPPTTLATVRWPPTSWPTCHSLPHRPGMPSTA